MEAQINTRLNAMEKRIAELELEYEQKKAQARAAIDELKKKREKALRKKKTSEALEYGRRIAKLELNLINMHKAMANMRLQRVKLYNSIAAEKQDQK